MTLFWRSTLFSEAISWLCQQGYTIVRGLLALRVRVVVVAPLRVAVAVRVGRSSWRS